MLLPISNSYNRTSNSFSTSNQIKGKHNENLARKLPRDVHRGIHHFCVTASLEKITYIKIYIELLLTLTISRRV